MTGSLFVDTGPSVLVNAIYFQEGPVELNGAFYGGSFINLNTIDVATGATATLNTALGESGGASHFTKTGAGTLNIISPSYTTGTTTVSGGTLNIINASNLSSGDISVTNGSTLDASGPLEFNSRTVSVSGTGSTMSSDSYLEVGRSANATLSITAGAQVSSTTTTAFGVIGGVTGTGSISGTGSTLTVGTDLLLGFNGTGDLTVSDNGTLRVLRDAYLGHSGGTGNLTLASGGTLEVGRTNGLQTLSGTGNLTLSGGQIKTIGSNLTSILPATLTSGTTSTIDTNGFSTELSGVLSGPGGLAKSGIGTLTLSGVNTYSGGTTVNAGTLFLENASSLGSPSGDLTLNGGILDLNTFNPGFGTVSLNGGTFTNGNLNNATTFNLLAGTYTIASDVQLGLVPGSATPGQLTLNGGTLATTSSFTIHPNRGIALGTSGGTFDVADSTTLSYASSIAGTGGFNKSGSGILHLTGDNTFGGNTNVTGGTLRL